LSPQGLYVGDKKTIFFFDISENLFFDFEQDRKAFNLMLEVYGLFTYANEFDMYAIVPDTEDSKDVKPLQINRNQFVDAYD
jgi:hypothetical protein